MPPTSYIARVLTLLMLGTAAANSQSVTAVRNVPRSTTVQRQGGATAVNRNPYVGAQIGYAFGNGEFASNLVTAGTFLYELDIGQNDTTPTFGFPVRGNIGPILTAGLDKTDDAAKEARDKAIQDLVISAQGIRVGIEPWWRIAGNDDKAIFQATLFASAGWKLNAVKDANDTTRYLAAGRVSGGIDFGLGRRNGGRLPIIITMAPVYSVFANDDFKKIEGLRKQYASGELTIVIPVAANAALLTEGIVASRRSPVWRIGLMAVAVGQTSDK